MEVGRTYAGRVVHALGDNVPQNNDEGRVWGKWAKCGASGAFIDTIYSNWTLPFCQRCYPSLTENEKARVFLRELK